jgi:hypothetical protein
VPSGRALRQMRVGARPLTVPAVHRQNLAYGALDLEAPFDRLAREALAWRRPPSRWLLVHAYCGHASFVAAPLRERQRSPTSVDQPFANRRTAAGRRPRTRVHFHPGITCVAPWPVVLPSSSLKAGLGRPALSCLQAVAAGCSNADRYSLGMRRVSRGRRSRTLERPVGLGRAGGQDKPCQLVFPSREQAP